MSVGKDFLEEYAEGDTIDAYEHPEILYEIMQKQEADEQRYRAVKELVEEGGTILDLTHGPGSFTEYLTDEYDVTAVCENPEIVSYGNQNIDDAEFVQGSLKNLPLNEESFDAVTLFGQTLSMLDSYEEVEEVLESACEVLNDGGYLITDLFSERTLMFQNLDSMETQIDDYYAQLKPRFENMEEDERKFESITDINLENGEKSNSLVNRQEMMGLTFEEIENAMDNQGFEDLERIKIQGAPMLYELAARK